MPSDNEAPGAPAGQADAPSPASAPGTAPAEQSQRVDGLPAEWTPEIRRIMLRINLAGCLAMVYTDLAEGSAQTEFARGLGFSEFQFGILYSIAPAMLVVQFLSAMVNNRLKYKKRLWIGIMVAHRALVVPVALLPWLLPDAGTSVWVWSMVGLLAVGQALGNFGQPMWFAWMGDLLPHRSLGEFWARRRNWLSLANACSMLASAGFFWVVRDWPIQTTYLIVAVVGSAAGIWDILLFLRVPERPGAAIGGTDWANLTEPFRDGNFRRFVLYSCYWSFAACFCAPFFRLFMLQVWGLPLEVVIFFWFFHQLGGAVFAEQFGRMVDRLGHRPMIVLCTVLKSLIVFGFLALRPGHFLWLMFPILLLDNMLNTGLMISRNGFMLKQSPRRNRSMFVAAVLAGSGLMGALGSLIAGGLLEHWKGESWEFLGMTWGNFHALFAIGMVVRWLAISAALAIREPQSKAPTQVLFEYVGPSIMRWLRYPLGFGARNGEEDDDEGNGR